MKQVKPLARTNRYLKSLLKSSARPRAVLGRYRPKSKLAVDNFQLGFERRVHFSRSFISEVSVRRSHFKQV